MKRYILILFILVSCEQSNREHIANYKGYVVTHIQWGGDDLGDTCYNLKEPKTGHRIQVHTWAMEASLYDIGDTIK